MFIARLIPLIHLCRLNKPVGIWLLMLPCWWGVALSLSALQKEFWQQLVLFFIGSVCLRSAGCIVNDWVDQVYDRQVARTRNRPLASHAVSKKQALFAFLFMLSGGAGVWFCLNLIAKILSICAFGLLFVYPFMKRITHWPQLVLGFAFNSGVLIGFANQHPLNSPQPWLLYGVGISWTLAYDTIYAFQDIRDDIFLNLKSTAILFKEKPHLLPFVCYGSMFIVLWILCTIRSCSWVSFFTLGCVFVLTFIRLKQWDSYCASDCLRFFMQNVYLGLLIFILLFF